MHHRFFKKLISNEAGATAIEYGLIAALITVAIVGSLTAMGDTFIANFESTTSSISGAMNNN